MKLKPFQIPEEIEKVQVDDRYAKFILSPLEKGMGITFGNAFRRVLLSSMQGSAITSVRINGVLHEFSSLDGVREDLPQIILNLKSVKLRMTEGFEGEVALSTGEKGAIYAKNIKSDGGFEVVNPEQLILTVMKKGRKLNMTLGITTGRGYVPREEVPGYNRAPIGTIYIDALYSPIEKVNFRVEGVGKGDRERLILEVWTDGRITPEQAATISAALLQDHLEAFLKIEKIIIVREKEESEEKRRLKAILSTKISEIELSVRAENCLKAAGVKNLTDLVQMTEQEMLKFPNFGKKSLQELSDILKSYKLSFGMKLPKLEGK